MTVPRMTIHQMTVEPHLNVDESMKEKTMSAVENARVFYESARSEMIERIGHRDKVLILYLGGVGALYGVALGNVAWLHVLLVVPYLALGAAMILSQHHAVIGQIGTYLAKELHPFFEFEDGSVCPPQWETSASRARHFNEAMMQRFLGHLFLIVIPALVALLFTRHLALDPLSAKGIVWLLGLCFTVSSLLVIVDVHFLRKSLA